MLLDGQSCRIIRNSFLLFKAFFLFYPQIENLMNELSALTIVKNNEEIAKKVRMAFPIKNHLGFLQVVQCVKPSRLKQSMIYCAHSNYP